MRDPAKAAFQTTEIVKEVHDRLGFMASVGRDDLTHDRASFTLLGGEAQRIKLSREFARRATGSTLYILDEPTTGLHFDDVRKLLTVLHALVDRGNPACGRMVVIEHHLDVIKTADWLIDLGPEGGEIVAVGTPEQIARVRASTTGHSLAPLLERPTANAS